jgi:hypothetical protein
MSKSMQGRPDRVIFDREASKCLTNQSSTKEVPIRPSEESITSSISINDESSPTNFPSDTFTDQAASDELVEEAFTCHQKYTTHTQFVVDVKFWLEGVLLSLTGL